MTTKESDTLTYREGYMRALQDVAWWVNKPDAPLAKRLCTPRNLDAVLCYIVEHIDEFMTCPDLFSFDFVIEKGKLKTGGNGNV